jgi:hypothetical protein
MFRYTLTNKYHVFSDKKLVSSVKERGRSGYDVKTQQCFAIGVKLRYRLNGFDAVI